MTPPPSASLPDATNQVLAARRQLQQGSQGATQPKKSEPAAASRARPVNNAALERLASVSSAFRRARLHRRKLSLRRRKKPIAGSDDACRRGEKEEVATPKALKKALEHEKTPELAQKLMAEAIERDEWAAQVSQMALPKLVGRSR
ncbi:DNA polymerase III subunit gamma/tau C-terminal domain-containing protein [Escherichia coli]